ncbi:unnamed protein product, partial [Prorocentrum cordatum]
GDSPSKQRPSVLWAPHAAAAAAPSHGMRHAAPGPCMAEDVPLEVPEALLPFAARLFAHFPAVMLALGHPLLGTEKLRAASGQQLVHGDRRDEQVSKTSSRWYSGAAGPAPPGPRRGRRSSAGASTRERCCSGTPQPSRPRPPRPRAPTGRRGLEGPRPQLPWVEHRAGCR